MDSLTPRAIDLGYGNVKYTRVVGGILEYQEFPAVAIPSVVKDIHVKNAPLARSDTLTVEANGRLYIVGPEAQSLQQNFGGRELDPTYAQGDKYAALMKGALAYTNTPLIDNLVLGLPLSVFQNEKEALENAWTGRIEIPSISQAGIKTYIEVRRVTVVPQPYGAFMSAQEEGKLRPELGDALIVDFGYYTLDYVVLSPRGALRSSLSGALHGGVSTLVRTLAIALEREIGKPIQNPAPIEKAWRFQRPALLYGREYSLQQYMGQVEAAVDGMVAELSSRLGDTAQIGQIVLAGGGASIFEAPIRAKFGHDVCMLEKPSFANIKGFQRIAASLGRLQASGKVVA